MTSFASYKSLSISLVGCLISLAFIATACGNPLPLHSTYSATQSHALINESDSSIDESDISSDDYRQESEMGLLLMDEVIRISDEKAPFEAGITFAAYTPDQEPPKKKASPKKNAPLNGVININTATANELTALPGIGPSLAKRIIDYRTQRRFEQPEHLKRVRGIGQSTFDKLKDHIAVQGSTTLAKG